MSDERHWNLGALGDQRYPPPFVLIERYAFAHAIAGKAAAADIIRAKGYRGPLAVIPQFGVDPDLFSPRSTRPEPSLAPAPALAPQSG